MRRAFVIPAGVQHEAARRLDRAASCRETAAARHPRHVPLGSCVTTPHEQWRRRSSASAATRIGWFMESLHSARCVPFGCWTGRLCMQNAPECQDLVTTRQDNGKTCRDVFANVKPSFVSRRLCVSIPDGKPWCSCLDAGQPGNLGGCLLPHGRDVLVLPVSISRRIRVPRYSPYRSDAEQLVPTPSCPECGNSAWRPSAGYCRRDGWRHTLSGPRFPELLLRRVTGSYDMWFGGRTSLTRG
jgi:hypothetical protein